MPRKSSRKKKFGPTHVVAGGTDEETVVYQTGTLYGEWPDGTAFEGNLTWTATSCAAARS